MWFIIAAINYICYLFLLLFKIQVFIVLGPTRGRIGSKKNYLNVVYQLRLGFGSFNIDLEVNFFLYSLFYTKRHANIHPLQAYMHMFKLKWKKQNKNKSKYINERSINFKHKCVEKQQILFGLDSNKYKYKLWLVRRIRRRSEAKCIFSMFEINLFAFSLKKMEIKRLFQYFFFRKSCLWSLSLISYDFVFKQ